MSEVNFLDIVVILLKAGVIDVKIKVSLPAGFLTALDKATADKEIDGKELADLIVAYQNK